MLQSFCRLIHSDILNRTELASFTSEATLLGGFTNQAVVPSLTFDGIGAATKRLRYEAWGTLGSTGTPTYTWSVRLGTTAANDITGTLIGITPACTTTSGVTNGTAWRLVLDICGAANGQGTNGLTITTMGQIYCGGLSPAVNSVELTAPPTETWGSASWNSLLTYYISLSATCSASSSSNKIRCKGQLLWELN